MIEQPRTCGSKSASRRSRRRPQFHREARLFLPGHFAVRETASAPVEIHHHRQCVRSVPVQPGAVPSRTCRVPMSVMRREDHLCIHQSHAARGFQPFGMNRAAHVASSIARPCV